MVLLLLSSLFRNGLEKLASVVKMTSEQLELLNKSYKLHRREATGQYFTIPNKTD
jgi:hypothetical protein